MFEGGRNPSHVDCEDIVPLGEIQSLGLTPRRHNPRVRDDNIQSAQSIECRADCCSDLFLATHVCGNALPAVGNRGLGELAPQVDNRTRRARLGEPLRDRASKTSRAAGYERRFPV